MYYVLKSIIFPHFHRATNGQNSIKSSQFQGRERSNSVLSPVSFTPQYAARVRNFLRYPPPFTPLLLKRLAWTLFCFVVNPRVLLANRVDLGFFVISFPILLPPPRRLVTCQPSNAVWTILANSYSLPMWGVVKLGTSIHDIKTQAVTCSNTTFTFFYHFLGHFIILITSFEHFHCITVIYMYLWQSRSNICVSFIR